MNSKSTYTLIFLLSFMATVETQSYASSESLNAFDYLKIQVDQKDEETKKTLQTSNAIIVKKAYALASLLKSKIEFLKATQYQNKVISKGYDLHSTGISESTNNLVCTHSRYATLISDYTKTLSI